MVSRPTPDYIANVRSRVGAPFWVRQDITVHIDPEFSSEDIANINNVIAEYNYVLNGNFHLDLDKLSAHNYDSGLTAWHLFKINSRNKLVKDIEPVNANLLGFATVGGDRLYVVRDRIKSSDILRALVRHEIGHLLGAHHTEKPGPGLMGDSEFNLDQYQCVDKETTDQIAFYNYLDAATLNYCEK
jgi:hypothetical protein